MPLLGWIVAFSFIGSVVSLIGGVFLLFRDRQMRRWSRELAAFAAGTLLGTAFFDLLPEALTNHEPAPILFATLAGFLAFLLFERSVLMIHVHDECAPRNASTPLIVVGDTLHNFVDGVVIGGTFLAGIPIGVVTSMAVAAHEIPQEMGDFIILRRNGMRRSRVLAVNVVSACATLVGAVSIFALGSRVAELTPHFLGVTSGFFIYIAAVDLIPDVHHERKSVLSSTIALLAGIAAILAATRLAA